MRVTSSEGVGQDILLLLVFVMNRLPTIENGGRNSIHHRRRAPLLYRMVDNRLTIKLVAQIYFIMTILWSLAYIMCKHRIKE